MTNKTYEIATVEDIANAIDNDNLDAFLADFKLLLLQYQLVKAVDATVKLKQFVWIDDGQQMGSFDLGGHGKLTIEIKKK